MRVLWIVSFVLPEASNYIGKNKIPFGGWISQMIDLLKKESSIELAVAMKSSIKKLKKVEDENITYYFLPTKDNDVSDVTSETCNFVFKDFSPDLLHAEGTEHKFTKTFLENWEGQNVVSLQGVLNGYKDYEYGGLNPFKLMFSPSHYKDIVYGFLMLVNKVAVFNKRINIERDTIGLAKNILGRTIWDQSHYYYFNKKAPYYHCNRILRPSFYNSYMLYDSRVYEKYSIFLGNGSQARKGAHFVIAALYLLKQDFPKIKLYIAGLKYSKNIQDPKSFFGYRSYLHRMIEKLELQENVKFLGVLNETDMAHNIKNKHVYVMSSIIENSPNTLGEAMMLGVPCVASYNGGVSQMANDEIEALLYRANDSKMLAYQIKRIFESNELMKRLTSNAYKKASITHDPSKNYQDLISCYQNILRDEI